MSGVLLERNVTIVRIRGRLEGGKAVYSIISKFRVISAALFSLIIIQHSSTK